MRLVAGKTNKTPKGSQSCDRLYFPFQSTDIWTFGWHKGVRSFDRLVNYKKKKKKAWTRPEPFISWSLAENKSTVQLWPRSRCTFFPILNLLTLASTFSHPSPDQTFDTTPPLPHSSPTSVASATFIQYLPATSHGTLNTHPLMILFPSTMRQTTPMTPAARRVAAL